MTPNNFPKAPLSYLWLRFLRTVQATINLTTSIILSIAMLLIVLGSVTYGLYYLYMRYFRYLPVIGGFHG